MLGDRVRQHLGVGGAGLRFSHILIDGRRIDGVTVAGVIGPCSVTPTAYLDWIHRKRRRDHRRPSMFHHGRATRSTPDPSTRRGLVDAVLPMTTRRLMRARRRCSRWRTRFQIFQQ